MVARISLLLCSTKLRPAVLCCERSNLRRFNPVLGSEMVGDALGTSLGGTECMLLVIIGAGVGGGSGGGNATVHATDGGGTTAVGPRPRHSLLVTSVFVVGVSIVSIVSIVRSVRESYSHTVQSI